MSKTQVNANGHFITVADATLEDTIIVGEAGGLVAGNVIAVKAADSKGYKNDGTEAYAAAIVGICDGTYAAAATASYFGNGDLATGLTGLTAGSEYFAKDDGTLAVYTSLVSTKWTRSMGVAKTTTSLQVEIGPVQQVP